MIFQRIGERGFRAVITGSRHAARILFIRGLRLGAPLRVQPDLMNVSKHAHDRAGTPAAPPTSENPPKPPPAIPPQDPPRFPPPDPAPPPAPGKSRLAARK